LVGRGLREVGKIARIIDIYDQDGGVAESCAKARFRVYKQFGPVFLRTPNWLSSNWDKIL